MITFCSFKNKPSESFGKECGDNKISPNAFLMRFIRQGSLFSVFSHVSHFLILLRIRSRHWQLQSLRISCKVGQNKKSHFQSARLSRGNKQTTKAAATHKSCVEQQQGPLFSLLDENLRQKKSYNKLAIGRKQQAAKVAFFPYG